MLVTRRALGITAVCASACGDPAAPIPIPRIADPPAGFLRFVAIDAGAGAVCGLTADSLTYCWGGPQLAGESFENRPVLLPVPKLGTISVGTHQEVNEHAMLCGSLATTEILCRGSAAGGSVTVPGSAGYANVSIGGAVCALAPDQSARCWRYTSLVGLLGIDAGEGLHGTPVEVAGGRSYGSIDVGLSSVCAVSSQGAVFCWGYNHALLARAEQSTDIVWTPHLRSPGSVLFGSVASLETHACALASDGRAFCWGMSSRGRLGRLDLTPVDCPGVTDGNTGQPAPCVGQLVEVSGARTFVTLAVGSHHTCGLTPNGEALCWGSGTWGELGNGRSGVANWSAAPVAVAGTLRFRTIVAGGFFTCATATNDATYCWGNNGAGQLGAGLPLGAFATVPTPVEIP